MLARSLKSLLALVLAASLIATSVQPAEARRGRGMFAGIALGLVALAIIEASRHRRHHHRYVERYAEPQPEPQCEWRGRTCFDNKYGDHVCQGGEYSCRP
jgi:hypothetical protein